MQNNPFRYVNHIRMDEIEFNRKKNFLLQKKIELI